MALQGENGISWAERTWNPIRGCSKVSAGCKNCYAEKTAARFSGPGMPYEHVVNNRGLWNGSVQRVYEHYFDPLRWTKPQRIFVNSMSDLFHEQLSDFDIARIFAVMALASRHTFQVLTKRADRLVDTLGSAAFQRDVRHYMTEVAAEWNKGRMRKRDRFGALEDFVWPLPNVWVGVSVEDQKAADERIPYLIQTPAAVRWLSMEPLLGPVDIGLLGTCPEAWGVRYSPLAAHIHWVVVGGESGPDARPMHISWVRALRDECQDADVAFHFKQWGEWHPAGSRRSGEPGRFAFGWSESYPTSYCLTELYPRQFELFGCRGVMERVGKHMAGRELDGRVWDEYPV